MALRTQRIAMIVMLLLVIVIAASLYNFRGDVGDILSGRDRTQSTNYCYMAPDGYDIIGVIGDVPTSAYMVMKSADSNDVQFVWTGRLQECDTVTLQYNEESK